jgi:hypothetical protein
MAAGGEGHGWILDLSHKDRPTAGVSTPFSELRVALPLVGVIFIPTNGRILLAVFARTGIPATKWPLHA